METETAPNPARATPTDDVSGVASAAPCSPFWYGVGAFFVAPVAAIFCVLMGLMMILAWPFIPFLCYMQRKEEISKASVKILPTREGEGATETNDDE